MEEIVEKLKLLNYETKFKPVNRLYFALPHKTNPTEQFHTFVSLISWVLQDVLKIANFVPPDQYDDPNATATNLSMICFCHL